jgi:fumarylacetoacetase
VKPPAEDAPSFRPSRALDYELEVGVLVGAGNTLGDPVPIAQAEQHVFGVCLLNDWSARDIQSWEYQPLGPFLAKSFASSLSPWVVTLEALAPFRCASLPRAADEPAPLPYLSSPANAATGGIDLRLEASIRSARMREAGVAPLPLTRSSLRDLYWTVAQMVAHHTSNGCNLLPGDLLVTGTVSGPGEEAMACLLEITRGGQQPIALPTGESRTYLEDGDEVVLKGYCERDGYRRIGVGACLGVVQPALP